MFSRKPNKPSKIQTLIGAKTRINGDVEFSGGLHLDGCINGNVSGHSNADTVLTVSEQGSIEGSVTVAYIVLNGVVKGDIDAANRVELGEKAQVMGNVQYTVIETAVGAQINGKLIHRAAPLGVVASSGVSQASAGGVDSFPGSADSLPGSAGNLPGSADASVEALDLGFEEDPHL